MKPPKRKREPTPAQRLFADELLYPETCANCGHLGEAHVTPSEHGYCPNDGDGCSCPGFDRGEAANAPAGKGY